MLESDLRHNSHPLAQHTESPTTLPAQRSGQSTITSRHCCCCHLTCREAIISNAVEKNKYRAPLFENKKHLVSTSTRRRILRSKFSDKAHDCVNFRNAFQRARNSAHCSRSTEIEAIDKLELGTHPNNARFDPRLNRCSWRASVSTPCRWALWDCGELCVSEERIGKSFRSQAACAAVH